MLFDVLVNIYEDYGYTPREAAVSIVQNNLWGLDIDDRAAQLAYFAVMMKARQYDRRFFSKGVQPHVYSIQESNGINREHLNYLGRGLSDIERNNAVNQMNTLLDEFIDAKEYGSILKPREYDWALLSRFVEDTTPMQQMTFGEAGLDATQAELRLMIAQGQALAQKYHAVVTNPPYMGASGMGAKLTEYVKAAYSDSKSDLFAVFIERIRYMLANSGYQAMITQHAWMFLSSFEKLRLKLMQIDTVNMAHLGARAFEEIGGEVVQTTAFVLRNSHNATYKGTYCRLIAPTTQQGKEDMFRSSKNRYTAQQDNFSKIPGTPVAYWISDRLLKLLSGEHISEQAKACIGMRTGDNERFLRFWFEVSANKFITTATCAIDCLLSKWVPYNKGGEYRKWYGNLEYVVNWENNGFEIKENTKLVYPQLGDNLGWKISNENRYFQRHITWTDLTTKGLSFRDVPTGVIFDASANAAFVPDKVYYQMLAFLNSVIVNTLAQIINPTMHFKLGNFDSLPKLRVHDGVAEIAVRNVHICKKDWDSFETSWDFQCHPLVTPAINQHYLRLADCWHDWERACDEHFAQLMANEEELNRIFIDIYGLQDELTPEVEDKDVTVRKADLGRDIRSLISYAVGCMLGRYSLDKPGLAFAGGNWQEWLAQQGAMTYAPDKDGILPITDDEYFYDDIVTIFVDWVKTVYGTVTLEENLTFIANALGGKGSPREVIREYFLNDFYKDHLKIYQKRPIYWLFDSGKKNGFKALVYMHRWQPDTIARVRTDYVHEMQSRYRTAIADVEQRINGASTSERVKLTKRLTALQAQAEELRKYEEKVHHLADQMIGIDLDDGVKVNYAKFADVLAPIK